ncbi:MAG: hypothetical protein ABR609_08390 [Acidimicrobiia bacterium]
MAVFLIACGGDASSETTVPSASALDFTLVLGSGDTFTLSEERRPVFLLFWAEW